MRRELAEVDAALAASAETHKRAIKAHRRALQDVNAARVAVHAAAARAATLQGTDTDDGVDIHQGEDGG